MDENSFLKELYLKNDPELYAEKLTDEYIETHREDLESQVTDLITIEAIEERERQRVKEMFTDSSDLDLVLDAMDLLTQEHYDILTEEEHQEISEGLKTIKEHSLVKMCQDPQFDLEAYLEGKELWQYFGLKKEYLEVINKLARTYLTQEQAEEGYILYSYLIQLNGAEPCYWHGLGISLALLGEDEEAIPCYETAFSLNPEDSFPLTSLMQSHIRCQNSKEVEETQTRIDEVNARM